MAICKCKNTQVCSLNEHPKSMIFYKFGLEKSKIIVVKLAIFFNLKYWSQMNTYKQAFNLLASDWQSEEEVDDKLLKSIELKYMIYDQYLAKDVNAFVNFLRNRDNFMYFLVRMKSLGMMPREATIYIVKEIVEPLFHDNFDVSTLKTFDQHIMIQVLLAYYTYYARNWKIFYDQYGIADEKYSLNTTDDDFDSLVDMEVENEAIKLYEQVIMDEYVHPIIKILYPLEKNLLSKDQFDEERMMKNFYELVTKNSFSITIQEFERVLPNILDKLKNIEIRVNFEEFTKEAISHIEHLQESVSFGKDGTFHKMNGVKQWISLLEKLQIDYKEQSAKLLIKAIKEYILAYSLKKAIQSNNKSNKIIGEKFAFISEFSPLLNYTKQLMDLDKPEFNYIFVKLIKHYSKATNDEINFLIDKFSGLKKSTFTQYESKNILPLIAEINCPLIEFY